MTPNTRTLKGQSYCSQRWANPAWPKGSKSRGFSTTAFADPENEGKILAAFSHLIKGKTVLVIAHRLSTITNADRILYVDKGVIAEQGTHEQLLALKGEYARMWETYNRAKRWTIGGKNNRKL